MKYKVIVYYDNVPDSEHIFSNKTESAANKSKIKRLGIELRQEMIDLERKYYV